MHLMLSSQIIEVLAAGAPPAAPSAWIGIPHPTDPVPSTLMPTLPTGADFTNHDWIDSYDPLTLAPPTHAVIAPNWPSAEQTNCYYADKFDGAATDTANTYGYPDKPRVTIPRAAFNAASLYLEVHGDNSAWVRATPQYDMGSGADVPFLMAGTKSTPRFVVGIDGPWVGEDFEIKAQHTIVDGIKWQERRTNSPYPKIKIREGAKYVCLRDVEIRGPGVSLGGGEVVGIAGIEADPVDFFVVVDSHIHHCGDDLNHNSDTHAFRPRAWSRHLWLLNSTINNVEGDGIQCGTSNNLSTDEANRTHYVYVGNCDFSFFGENCLDNKNSYHVIAGDCVFHDTDKNLGSNDTGVIISNNSEGPLTGYHWLINTEMYACAPAVRFAGGEVLERDYVVGCWFHDNGSGLSYLANNDNPTSELWIINNTVVENEDNGMNESSFGATKTNVACFIRNNITYNCVNNHVEASDPAFGSHEVSRLIGFNISGPIIFNEGDFSPTIANQIDVDPEFTNPGADDYTLKSTSPALGAVGVIDPVYQLFEDLYGINMRFDINGNPIPLTNADIGAYQRV